MPDLKISQLPAASTPLAGTELVPIVQGGTTDQTTVQAILTSAVPSGTANGVLFLNGSKVVTSGSGLTFDGNGLGINAAVGSTEALRAKIKNIDVQLVVQDGFASGNLRLTAVDAGYTTYKNLEFSAAQSLFYVSGSEAMRLTSTGLGIGTSSPSQKVEVSTSGTSAIQITSTSGTAQLMLNPSGTNPAYINYNRSSASVLAFYDQNAGAERMRLDSSGNLGLGVTPSAWDSGYRAAQVGDQSVLVGFNGNFTWLGTNWVSSAGGDKYIANGYATIYRQNDGTHAWYTAPSGTAGNAISFTQAMTLDASGNLLVGGTTQLYGAAGRGLIQVSGSSQALLGFGTTGNVGLGFLYHTGTNFELTNAQNGYLSFGTNNTERLRLKSTGQLRYVPLSSDPAGAEAGDVYYNSSTNKLRVYNGTAWVDLH